MRLRTLSFVLILFLVALLMVHGKGTADGRPLKTPDNTLNVVKAGKANEVCGKDSNSECKGKHKRDAGQEEGGHVFENEDYIYTQSIP